MSLVPYPFALATAAARVTFALSITAFCALACSRSSLSAIGSTYVACHVIDDDFEERCVFCGVDGKLEFAVFNLEFSGDWLAFPFTGHQCLLQANLGMT